MTRSLAAELVPHAFLSAAIRPTNLSAKAGAIISDRSQEVEISVVSFREIALKHAFGEGSLKKARNSRDDLVNGLAVVNLQAFAAGNFEFP